MLADHIAGRAVIAVDSLFFYEVLSVASRGHVPEDALRVWSDLKRLELVTVPLGDELLQAAVSFRAAHGCSLYDAFSAGLADLLDAPLYSADARAHGKHRPSETDTGIELIRGRETPKRGRGAVLGQCTTSEPARTTGSSRQP